MFYEWRANRKEGDFDDTNDVTEKDGVKYLKEDVFENMGGWITGVPKVRFTNEAKEADYGELKKTPKLLDNVQPGLAQRLQYNQTCEVVLQYTPDLRAYPFDVQELPIRMSLTAKPFESRGLRSFLLSLIRLRSSLILPCSSL